MDKQLQALVELQNLVNAFNEAREPVGRAYIRVEPLAVLGLGKVLYGAYVVTGSYTVAGHGATFEEALTTSASNFQAVLNKGGSNHDR